MRRTRAVGSALGLGLAVFAGSFLGPVAPAGAAGPCFISPNKGFSVPVGGEFSFDPDPTQANARWSGTIDWGDGSAPTRFGNGDHDVVHQWTKPGTFTMAVTASGTIEGSDGNQTPCSNTATVVARAQVTAPLTAAFQAAASGNGRTFTFDASDSTPQGQITTYAWTFGDGASGSGVRVRHTFTLDRPYSVALTVSDASGKRAQAQQRVQVPAGPATGGGTPAATSSTARASSPAATSKPGSDGGIPASAIAAGAAGALLLAAGAYSEIQRRRAGAADALSGAAGAITREVQGKLAWVEGFARSVAEGQPAPSSGSFGVVDPNHPSAPTGQYQPTYLEVVYDEDGMPHFVPLGEYGTNSVSVASPG